MSKFEPIRVLLRVRPSAVRDESSAGSSRCLHVEELTKEITCVGPTNNDSSSSQPSGSEQTSKVFKADAVWDSGAKERRREEGDQEEFYKNHIEACVQKALVDVSTPLEVSSLVNEASAAPKHVAILAYGQTGSGKTFAMEGGDDRQRQQREIRRDESPSAELPESGEVSDTGAVDEEDSEDVQQVSAGEGIIPRAIDQTFRWRDAVLRNSKKDHGDEDDDGKGSAARLEGVRVKVSFVEIYQEQLADLLAPQIQQQPAAVGSSRKPDSASTRGSTTQQRNLRWKGRSTSNKTGTGPLLRVRHVVDGAGRRRAVVDNLTTCSCESFDEAMGYHRNGASNRRMRAHGMNDRSSRSHTIFTMAVEYQVSLPPVVPTGQPILAVVTADICLVDLAGSERLTRVLPDTTSGNASRPATSASARAALVSESIRINQSLLALGKVIMQLSSAAHNKKVASGAAASTLFVPYRDSKLTTLLQHAFGGNAHTMLVACLHPDTSNRDESLSTLFYATRARGIRNGTGAASNPHLSLVQALKAEIERLKEELSAARAMNAARSLIQQPTPTAAAPGVSASDHATADDSRFRAGESVPVGAVDAEANVKLANALVQACERIETLHTANSKYRDVANDLSERLCRESAEVRELEAENRRLRERSEALETLLLDRRRQPESVSSVPSPSRKEPTGKPRQHPPALVGKTLREVDAHEASSRPPRAVVGHSPRTPSSAPVGPSPRSSASRTVGSSPRGLGAAKPHRRNIGAQYVRPRASSASTVSASVQPAVTSKERTRQVNSRPEEEAPLPASVIRCGLGLQALLRGPGATGSTSTRLSPQNDGA